MIQILSKELDMDTETVRKRVEKVSSIERIKTNVENLWEIPSGITVLRA